MKKLFIALAALALSTGATAQHYYHDNGHHYGQRYHHERHGGVRFGIYVNPYSTYGYGFASPYRYIYSGGYYGPTWQTYNGYVGCTQYGRNGLLVDRFGDLVSADRYYSRSYVHCDVRY